MTVSSQRTAHRYVGDGTQNSWPILFRFLQPEHVKALKTTVGGATTPLEYGSDYSVEELESGGRCTASLNAGEQITLFLDVPLTQETDLRDSGRLAPEVLERMADKLTLALQQQREDLDRCVKVPFEASENPDAYVQQVFAVKDQALQVKSAAETAVAETLAYREESAEQVELAAAEVSKAMTVTAEAAAKLTEMQQLVEQARQLIEQASGGTEPVSDGLLSGMVVPFKGSVNDGGYPVDRNTGTENRDYALCDGRTYTAPDGTSVTTPDLRNRFIAGAGLAYAQGDTGGADLVALSVEQMPAHTHSFRAASTEGESTFNDLAISIRTTTAPRAIGETGGSQAHENRPPYYALAYLMKL